MDITYIFEEVRGGYLRVAGLWGMVDDVIVSADIVEQCRFVITHFCMAVAAIHLCCGLCVGVAK